jgi:hypothetical protein
MPLVFPNPSKYIIQINLEDFRSENVNISLYSISGYVHYSKNYSSEKSCIQLSMKGLNLSQGVYTLILSDEENIVHQPIIYIK